MSKVKTHLSRIADYCFTPTPWSQVRKNNRVTATGMVISCVPFTVAAVVAGFKSGNWLSWFAFLLFGLFGFGFLPGLFLWMTRHDWSILPSHLRYLIVPAEKFGHYEFDDAIIHFLAQKATDADKRELTFLANEMVEDDTEINAWLDSFDKTKHKEARLIYGLERLIVLGYEHGYLKDSAD